MSKTLFLITSILSAAVGIVIIGIVAWLFTVLLTAGRPPAAKDHA